MFFENKYIEINKNSKSILKDKIILNKSLFLENNKLKSNIDEIPYNIWKIIRSICSEYEIVGNNKIHQNYKIKKINSISRAYFKLLEILNVFENFLEIKNKKSISIDCLCEAPGGFIKCLYDYRNNKDDRYKTISIKNTKNNIIKWNINNIENLEIIYGDEKQQHDGNIFNPQIINYYIKSHKNKSDLVTADGGLLLTDYKENFKSNFHINLFICELYIALKILKRDGVFILKVYELSTEIMVDFLIILNHLFEKVKIFKPKTSREMNNEKYIICKNLLNNNNNIINYLWKIIKDLWNNKNLLLINMINYKKQEFKHLISIFNNIDYNNLFIQNTKLKYAMDLKDKNLFQLKIILKNKKPVHFYNAYNWFKLNNILVE